MYFYALNKSTKFEGIIFFNKKNIAKIHAKNVRSVTKKCDNLQKLVNSKQYCLINNYSIV